MRWITFLLLLYGMTALQAAKVGAFPSGLNGGNLWPEVLFIPMLAVFYALFAAEGSAPLAALACGAAYDFANDEFIGTNMIPLALVVWFIVRIRLSLFRENAISQVLMTLLAVLAFGAVSVCFRALIGAKLSGQGMWPHFVDVGGDAVYTAVVAPVFFWVFFRVQGLLGFTSHGPRGRGHA